MAHRCLQHPQRIFAIVAAVRQAVPAHVPVSAKLRLGWENPDDIYRNAERAMAAGASWLTVHARTRMQAYRPPALWAPLRQLAREAAVVVVANGDLWDLDALRRCRDVSQCQHFMLGRCAVANPSLAAALAQELGLASPPPQRLLWPSLMRRFVHLSQLFGARPTAIPGRLKQWARMSPALCRNGCYAQIRTLRTTADILAAVEQVCAGADICAA